MYLVWLPKTQSVLISLDSSVRQENSIQIQLKKNQKLNKQKLIHQKDTFLFDREAIHHAYFSFNKSNHVS